MSYEINPSMVHATLVDVAADGESLRTSADRAQTAGDTTGESFGTATEVTSAFATFWGSRSDVGVKVATLLLHKSACVATAAEAFINADGDMTDTASTALDQMTAQGQS